MTTTTRATTQPDALHPALAAAAGAITFVGAMVAGELSGLNSSTAESPATTWGDLAGYAGLVLAAAVLAVWLAVWARAGTLRRHAGVALGLAVAAVATIIGFWSGWPHVLGAVAMALALGHRRRLGSFSAVALTAFVLGAVSLAAATVLCVTG